MSLVRVPSTLQAGAAAVLGYAVLYFGGRHGYPVLPAIDYMPSPIFELENGSRRVIMTAVPFVVGIAAASAAGRGWPRLAVALTAMAVLACWIGIISAARSILFGDAMWLVLAGTGTCLVLAWAVTLRAGTNGPPSRAETVTT